MLINHCWVFFIAGFTCLCPANSTPRFFSSRTLARGLLISYCVPSIAARENPPSSMLAIFKASCILGCSSCTRPPCLTIVADKLKTYKKLVAGSKRKIQLLPQPYTTPYPPPKSFNPVSSTPGNLYHKIHQRTSQRWRHHDVRFRGQCGHRPSLSMEVCHCGQRRIGNEALYVTQQYIITLVHRLLYW